MQAISNTGWRQSVAIVKKLSPELISRLIWATATPISKIEFPTGDSVTTGGWDGCLDTSAVSPFFPTGISGWEMGVDGTPGKKAEKDYATRTPRPFGLSKRKSTFVFVTPRPWPKRGEWEAKNETVEGRQSYRRRWAGTMAGGGSCRRTVACAADRQSDFGRHSRSGRDVGGMVVGNGSAIAPGVVISGRSKDIEQVHQWLSAGASMLECKAIRQTRHSRFSMQPSVSFRMPIAPRLSLAQPDHHHRQALQPNRGPYRTAASNSDGRDKGEC